MSPSMNTQFGSSDKIMSYTEDTTIFTPPPPPFMSNGYFDKKIQDMFHRPDKKIEALYARSDQNIWEATWIIWETPWRIE